MNGGAMAEQERIERKEEGPDLWSSPYPGIGLGFAVAAVMISVTTGIFVSGLGFVIPAAGGHVVVESKNEALFYSLAGRGYPELEGPSGR